MSRARTLKEPLSFEPEDPCQVNVFEELLRRKDFVDVDTVSLHGRFLIKHEASQSLRIGPWRDSL